MTRSQVSTNARRRRRWWPLLLAAVLLLVGPVLITQLVPDEQRSFDWVSLDEMSYREIRFRNARQNLELAGMLFMPERNTNASAAVVIHGSGTSVRDNGWYLTLARHLKDNGIAVLLPDKRGSESSQGDWRTASLHDLAGDTIAAIEALQSVENIDTNRIGVIGMSQGGWIAPIVARENSQVAFVVSVVGSAVTPIEQLYYEEVNNLRQIGLIPGAAHVLAALSTRYIRNVAQKSFWTRIGDFDPLPYWREIPVPSLVLFGSEDTNVPTEESVQRLRALGNTNIDVRVFDGSGHALESPLGQGNSIFRDDALDAIAEFITRSD